MKTLLLLATLTLLACGESDKADQILQALEDSNTVEAEKEVTTNPLIGSWLSECEDNARYEMRFSKDALVTKLFVYDDTEIECTGDIVLSTISTRSYVIDDNKIDYTYKKFEMIPKAPFMVEYLNDSIFFGFTSWRLNEAKDITNIGDAYPHSGTVKYNIFKVENGKLYLGDLSMNDGTTESQRPASYEDFPYELQK